MKYSRLNNTTYPRRGQGSVVLWLLLILIPVSAGMIWTAWEQGKQTGMAQAALQSLDHLQAEIEVEREQIVLARQQIDDNLDALALRVGSIRAHSLRLDALGERLVGVGDLDPQEFDFKTEPALGGYSAEAGESTSADEISTELLQLGNMLRDREEKLLLMEAFMASRQLRDEVMPSGRPLTKGWLSSGFGKRVDPFTGKKKYHRGLDFSGKTGTDIIAVAAGVVIESGKNGGYGNVVEIQHGGGYVTRYAHNKKNLVVAGDVVEKGQTIALLGSSGRSSGPHVHFEVHKNDKIINPRKFINK